MAKATGNKVKFTWSPTGADDIFETRGHGWTFGVRMPMHDTTSELATASEWTPGVSMGQMGVRLFVDASDGTPTIPTGTSGTVTLYPYHAIDAADLWTGTAYVESMQFQATSVNGAPAEVVVYTLRLSGTITRTSA